jgi:hypothetical protein
MRETGKPTFVVWDYYWRARLRTRGSARSRGSRVVSTHGLNTHSVCPPFRRYGRRTSTRPFYCNTGLLHTHVLEPVAGLMSGQQPFNLEPLSLQPFNLK